MDGSPRPSSSRWTYKVHEQIGSAGSYTVSNSSRSGTIVSTANTSGASRSSLSTTGLELKFHSYEHLSWGERTKEEKMKRVIELVDGGATSSALNLKLKKWFKELNVAWVLDLPDDAVSALHLNVARSLTWTFIRIFTPRWIDAFAEIVETIRFMSKLPFPDPCSHTGEDDEQAVPNQFFLLMRVTTKILQRLKSKLLLTNELMRDDRASIPDQIQFARFTQVVMLKMLAFVDVLVAVDHCSVYTVYGIPRIHTSLNLLLAMHGVLSKALHVIYVLLVSSPPGEVQSILGEISRLLSTKEEKALHALCLTLNDTTTRLLERIEDSSTTQTLQLGSSDIHKVTLHVISHISFLMDNKLSLDQIISEADNRGKVFEDLIVSEAHNRGKVYETRIGNQTHSDSMIIRMASCLQEKLASLSESFPDQSLMFLFLLNNSHRLHKCFRFIELGSSSLQLYAESLFTKVYDYMQSYLQVSWAPVLSCLFNPTPHLLGKNYSPLTRFVSEFEKTCITQKQWMVSDPELRKNLRTAIIDQVIPAYTKYIEENNITTPRLAPQELQEMLQDLFEG